MHAGASPALAILRVKRGAQRPSEKDFAKALDEDRKRLHLPASNGHVETETAGPYAIHIDGTDLDEYVVWER